MAGSNCASPPSAAKFGDGGRPLGCAMKLAKAHPTLEISVGGLMGGPKATKISSIVALAKGSATRGPRSPRKLEAQDAARSG